jgi:hypothetical protein
MTVLSGVDRQILKKLDGLLDIEYKPSIEGRHG